MNDQQIIDALRNARVTARSLDPDQVIAGARRRRARTWVASTVAVAAVVAVVAAALSFGNLGRIAIDDPVVTPTPKPSLTSIGTLITIGPVEKEQANQLGQDCLRRYTRASTATGTVVYAMKVRDITGLPDDYAIAIRNNEDNKLYGCFGFAGSDGPSGGEMTIDVTMGRPGGVPEGPVVKLTGGGTANGALGPANKRYIRMENWYQVDPGTVRIRQRYLVHRVPTGGWFETDVVDGHAFMRAWLPEPIKKVADPAKEVNTVGLETYAIDENGKATRLFGPYDDEFPAEMFPGADS
jgi:hypothetical protein